MSTPQTKPPKWQIYVLAARPKTLWASVVPVIMGGAMAFDSGRFYLLAFVVALLAAMLIQIGANYANDLFDFLKATDRTDRLGPLRVTQAGLVTSREMKIAIAMIFTLTLLLGVYLVARGGVPILLIGVTAIMFAIGYTAGPLPLGYVGLGDLFVLIYFGPVAVAGTYFVVTHTLTRLALLTGLPAGMLSVAILTVNNLRDVDSDRRGGKKTLAVRCGRRFAQFEYLAMILIAGLFPILLARLSPQHSGILLACLTLVAAVRPIKTVFTQQGVVLNKTLAQTGGLLALFGLLFAIGWLL